ncbi:MAG TPA: M56 family metallopeptidase [Burkholderiaceae bacterium]
MSAAITTALQDWTPRLAWALLHFAWQGTLIAAATVCALAILRHAKPQARYAVACAALAACVLLPLYTLMTFSAHVMGPIQLLRHANGGVAGATALISDTLRTHLHAIAAAWACGVLLLGLRLAGACWWVHRLTLSATAAPQALQDAANALAARLHIERRITLRLTHSVDTPLTLGWLRPLVLIPASLACGMPAPLLEALLAHEIAHVRRHDYLINLLQSTAEIFLFYHPAVWWLSRRIRCEREQVADDVAARVLGEPRRLALALRELDAFQYANQQTALAANGGDLMKRITRLLRPQTQLNIWKAVIPLTAAVLTGTALYANALPAPAPSIVTGKLDVKKCAVPQYPAQAKDRKEQGMVIMRFHVAPSGTITSGMVEKSSGHPELDNAALESLSRCEAEAGRVDGKPVDSQVRVAYDWRL